MIFTLEALGPTRAIACSSTTGRAAAPLVAVIDGGPSGVYKRTLRPRLDELRASRSPDALQLQLVAVSHIDDDHMRGVLDLVERCARGGR